jgi:flagellin-like hook-associated protein FlgL
MHINRNMRKLDGIIRQIETGQRIQRPSDDPIIASRALMFRTSVHENAQFQRNVDQGVAWMNVTESTFNNINKELLFEMRNLAVQGANGDNNLQNMQAIIRQMNSLFNQLGHEMNQTFGGNYLFSGFRTNEPPMFTADNNRTFVITQHFDLSHISREMSFQRLIVPGGLGTYEPVTENISVLKLAFTGADPASIHIPGFTVVQRGVDDSDAYLPPAPIPGSQPVLHFIPETGELVMHSETAANFPREGVSVTYRKTGFRQGDINPAVYFTGREIIDPTFTPQNTQLIYNVTQYFSRAAGTLNGNMMEFTLEFMPYDPNGDGTLPEGLETTLMYLRPHIATLSGNILSIPVSFFDTNSHVSFTYPVELFSPILTSGYHIMEDTRFQGVELVRAIADNGTGVSLPLHEVEPNHSLNMRNQYIEYEFASRTRIAVNSLAKNVLTDKMFADFRRFFEFSDSIQLSNQGDLEQFFRSRGFEDDALAQAVEDQLAREGAMARDALHQKFNNMLFLIDRHADNATREQTLLGARMVRMELVQNRLEEDEVSYTQLTSDNEDTDLIRATIMRFSAEAIFMASLRANSGIIQMSLANFLR